MSASETNFRNFFETIDDMFIITDLEGNIFHANQSLTDKLGYSLSELINTDIRNLHPADKRFEIADLVKRLLDEELDVGHLEIESKSGKKFVVDSRLWMGTWNGKPCIYTISKDITEEMENLQLFTTTFEKNPLPMAIVSAENDTISKVNPEFIKKTGYTENDIIGKSTEELNIFIDLEKKEEIKNKRLAGGDIIDEELSIRCKDNRTLIGLFLVEKIISKGEKSLLIVMVDITESVKLRRTIEENYKKLTQIIEATRVGTWELDLRTGSIQCNDYWTEFLGYSLAELAPINMARWEELTHPADLATAYKKLNKHINGEAEYYEYEMRLKHKDGHWIWSQARGKITEVDANGKPLKMFGTHTDVSHRKQAEQKLRESERRFFLALDKTEAGLWDIDLVNRRVFLSPMWKQILGYSDHEIDNSMDSWKELIHPGDLAEIKKLGKIFFSGKSDTYESISRFRHKDGSWRWILIRGGVLNNEDGVPTRLIGTNLDITREHEQALELEGFFSVNLDLLCITTLQGEFIKTNKAWEEILGYPSAELKGQNFLDFVHPEDIQATLEAMEDLSNQKEVTQFINRYISRDGTYRYIEWRSTPYGNNIYAAARDITDRKKYEEEILEISNRDSLTNVYNRGYIYNRIQEMLDEYRNTNQVLSICLIDIDDFKLINDTYGHQVGDYILQEFTKEIDANLRPNDLLGRYGGEEFIVVLDGIDAEKSYVVLERILKIIRNKIFNFDRFEINFTFSAGVSTSSEVFSNHQMASREKVEVLINMADQRMYHAKGMGKNRVVFEM